MISLVAYIIVNTEEGELFLMTNDPLNYLIRGNKYEQNHWFKVHSLFVLWKPYRSKALTGKYVNMHAND